jgi:anthranilate phosphoribosyltransferase
VVANSAMSFYIAGRTSSFEEGARLAEEIIDGGAALGKLDEYISLTRES